MLLILTDNVIANILGQVAIDWGIFLLRWTRNVASCVNEISRLMRRAEQAAYCVIAWQPESKGKRESSRKILF
jgi:hypothetical protein